LYENVAFVSDKIDLTEDIVNIIETSTPWLLNLDLSLIKLEQN
jgi:hypothetical protein